LRGAAGRTRDPAVLQPGLPAGRRAARAAEPEDPYGAAGHRGLLDDRPDRTRRRRRAIPHRQSGRRRHGRCRAAAAQAGPHHRGRGVVHGDLLDLRPQRVLRDLPGHRPPMGQGLPETAGARRRAAPAGGGEGGGGGGVERPGGAPPPSPVCAIPPRPDPSFWKGCPACGHPQLSTRSCTRCNLRQRLRVLLAGGGSDVRAELRGLHDALAASERPNLVLAWLNKTATASVLREFGTGQRAISHAALDEPPVSKPAEPLRAILVATGTLPPRDEPLARLERWIEHTLAERSDPGQRQLLHRYAIWHVLRRLRRRTNTTHATHAQAVTAQRHIKAAIALLDGLAARGHTLASARQGD